MRLARSNRSCERARHTSASRRHVRPRAVHRVAGGNRKGYAGYEFDPALAYSIWHVRNRVLNSDLGRWTRRDPFGYLPGDSLNAYAGGNPMPVSDPFGLAPTCGNAIAAIVRTNIDDPYCQEICDLAQIIGGGRAYGGSRCCGMYFCMCICLVQIEEDYFSEPARGIIADCVTTHEGKHSDHWDCCRGQECGNRDCNECEACNEELNCILTHCNQPAPAPPYDGTPTSTCRACNGDPLCEANMRRYYNNTKKICEEDCAACAQAQDPAP
jgi:RHS repeat-associated protein